MIDSHAHINTEAFNDDRGKVIQKAFDSGVEAIIIPAIEPKEFDSLFATIDLNDRIFCGIGIHPHNANEIDNIALELVRELAQKSKVVAIGEIGLDYYYDFAPKDRQKEAFRKQIKIAKELELPIIVHNRESDEDLLKILENEQDGNLEGVLHCFSSSTEMLTRALKLNFHVSFTGNITFKKSKLAEVVSESPLDKILLETDSPYMTPVPHRGKRNEPANVRYVAEKIAEIKSISINEVIEMTTRNAKRLFRLITFMFLIFAIGLFAVSEGLAQDEFEEVVNPYPKGLGFGLDVGTNTIVATQYNGDLKRSISYEGVFFWGGLVNLSVFDWMMLEASYNYTKNNKIVEKSNGTEGPNIHQVIELSAQFIANPMSRINFYGTAGFSMFFNTINKDHPDIMTTDHPLGFNFGVGFKINLPAGSIGTIVPFLEWRLNWAPARVKGITFWDPSLPIPIEIESTQFFSMPRLGVIFYPSSLFSLNLDN